MAANKSKSDRGIGYYWVFFITNEETDDLTEDVFKFTTYAEFVCYKNETYEMVLNNESLLVVQGIIQTDVENLQRDSDLHDYIASRGKKWCVVDPLPPSLLGRKRLFLQYACVMYPNAYLYTSLGEGNMPLKTIVADKQKAIADYLAVSEYALDEDEHRLSLSVPPEYFDWYRHCQYITELEFDCNHDMTQYLTKILTAQCDVYLSDKNNNTIDAKKEAIYYFMLDEKHKKKLYWRKVFLKKVAKVGPIPEGMLGRTRFIP